MTAFQPQPQPQPQAPGFADAFDAIRRDRRPLPAHDLSGGNARRWAAAVLQAEVDHAAADFWSLASAHGVYIDRYTDPDCHARYRLPHEIYAGAALNWLSHIISHEAIDTVSRDRRDWLLRKRYLLHGFLRQVAKYRAARSL